MFNGPIKEISDRLSGTSLDVEVSCNDHSFLESLLFTHRGISGPSILQISSYWLPGDSIILNLMPYNDAQLLLLNAKKEKEGILLRTFLSKLLPKALVIELQNLWWSDFSDKPFAELNNKLLKDIGGRLNRWELKPSETEGYRTAEVTLGGVNTDGISSKTMEAIGHPGLYFVGEVLDVSGHLGGFNFQWAWASGYTAGLYA
jgi:predicted Rossmann fold flavoprotein